MSIKAEIEARNYYKFPDDLLTLFIVEYGADPITVDIIKQYPFKSYCVFRQKRLGLSRNILEGQRESFHLTDDFIFYIEDDVLLHKTYFQYMDVILNSTNLGGPFSIISSYVREEGTDPSAMFYKQHYCALAPVIFKHSWEKFMVKHANSNYYDNHAFYVVALNEQYKKYWGETYKYQDSMHYQQAGLWNRGIDILKIDYNMDVITPVMNRQQHIGIYGENRALGEPIPGNTFMERVDSLREIIKDPNKMYSMAGSKCYNDYCVINPILDGWDGTLYLK
ncbi:MAG: hypothetical protein U9R15_17445 [Chloroflexota bacterium]|nr:hypothetical protein [Chloroflexota bacterium]